MERTLGIIKPDAVGAGQIGRILARVEKEGFRIAGLRLLRLSTAAAEGFYAVHRERPFFRSLVDFMTSGPVVVMVLERDGAVAAWRTLMGATDPGRAEPGTLRREFGTNVERNATHGSDAPGTASAEIAYFFNALDLCAPSRR
jgi:nucleoside-diphosphate kinase